MFRTPLVQSKSKTVYASERVDIDLVTGATRGLRLDAEIVRDVLKGNFAPRINISRERNLHLAHRRLYRRMARAIHSRPSVNLFFENVRSGWLATARFNVLIPNQEWIRDEVAPNIAKCDEVWCKTRYAMRAFEREGYKARYVGFTSRDVLIEDVEKDYSRCLHVAGRSHLKGTRTLLALWRRHPEWPRLTVVTQHEVFATHAADNVDILLGDIAESTLIRLMNESGVHLCPSETEGFGHYIAEAMSCGSLVITTDAPPMNELVSPGNGLVAAYVRQEPMGFGSRFFVAEESLEAQIATALDMSVDEKIATGKRARNAFLASKREFSNSLTNAMKALIGA